MPRNGSTILADLTAKFCLVLIVLRVQRKNNWLTLFVEERRFGFDFTPDMNIPVDRFIVFAIEITKTAFSIKNEFVIETVCDVIAILGELNKNKV